MKVSELRLLALLEARLTFFLPPEPPVARGTCSYARSDNMRFRIAYGMGKCLDTREFVLANNNDSHSRFFISMTKFHNGD